MTTIQNPANLYGGTLLDSEMCSVCRDEVASNGRGIFTVTDNITDADERAALARSTPTDPERACRRCGLRERSA
jgi:hypothetical protein